MEINIYIATSWEDSTGESYEPRALLLELQWLHNETTMDNSTGNFQSRDKFQL